VKAEEERSLHFDSTQKQGQRKHLGRVSRKRENEVLATHPQETLLQCIECLYAQRTFCSSGLDFKLTGIEPFKIIRPILA
jgi:hypothetical protein